MTKQVTEGVGYDFSATLQHSLQSRNLIGRICKLTWKIPHSKTTEDDGSKNIPQKKRLATPVSYVIHYGVYNPHRVGRAAPRVASDVFPRIRVFRRLRRRCSFFR